MTEFTQNYEIHRITIRLKHWSSGEIFNQSYRSFLFVLFLLLRYGNLQLPQFDNMYLDMNGIIHNCSHPDDSNVHFRITEEQIFRDIFRYIDTLFRLIRPQKLFFMAVDGVAPRAKMNQQRGRRFRSAKEAIDLVEKAKQKGETLPTESRFDSNCITPGTAFMARLQDALKHFVKVQLSTDPAWQHCRIILSGHEVSVQFGIQFD